MDLVDLLFKRKYISNENLDKHFEQELREFNPILTEKILDNFEFIFYIALNCPEDIHPMSFYQLSYLCDSKFSCVLRLKQKESEIKSVYKNFEFTKERFDHIILPQV